MNNTFPNDMMTLCWGVQYLCQHPDELPSVDGARWLAAVAAHLQSNLLGEEEAALMLPYAPKLKEYYDTLNNSLHLRELRGNLKTIIQAMNTYRRPVASPAKPLSVMPAPAAAQPVRRGRPAGHYLRSDSYEQQRQEIIRQVLVGLYDPQKNKLVLDGTEIVGAYACAYLYNIGMEEGWTADDCNASAFYTLLRKVLQKDSHILQLVDETTLRNYIKSFAKFFPPNYCGKCTLLAANNEMLDKLYRNPIAARAHKEVLMQHKSKLSKLRNFMVNNNLLTPIKPDNS